MLPSFFIVGCGRSGTTLLRNVLCSHPAILIPPETSFFFWHRSLHADRTLTDAECRRVVKELRLDRTSRFRGGHFLRRELSFFETDWDRFHAGLLGRPQSSRRAIDVLEILMEDWLRRQDKDIHILGEKTPHHVFAIRRILRSLPEARFIHMIRDPRAVVPSLLEMPWFDGGTAAAAFRWRTSVDAFRSQVDRIGSERCMEVRYEDLVSDLSGTSHRLAGFLGLPFDERMLEPERYGARYMEAQAWHGMSRTAVATGVNDRRKSSLDALQRCVIERIACDRLESYGYPPPSEVDSEIIRKADGMIRRERLLASVNPRRLVRRSLERFRRAFG